MAGQHVVRSKKSCMIVSAGERASLAITFLEVRDGKARFIVSIANRTGAPLVVDPGQICASNESGRDAKIFSAGEMQFQAAKRAGTMASTVERRAVNQFVNQFPPDGSCLEPVAERIDARASDRLSMIGERLDKDLKETEKVLEPMAILPHKIHSSLLVTKVFREIRFHFTVANEPHDAFFTVEKVRPKVKRR